MCNTPNSNAPIDIVGTLVSLSTRIDILGADNTAVDALTERVTEQAAMAADHSSLIQSLTDRVASLEAAKTDAEEEKTAADERFKTLEAGGVAMAWCPRSDVSI
jgi:hypothetical protein